MEEKEVKLTNTSDSISSKSTITGACEGTGGVATCPISTAVISCLIQTLIDIYQFIEIHISVLLFLFFLVSSSIDLKESHKPVQFTPFPRNPLRQVQAKDPGVFEQVA